MILSPGEARAMDLALTNLIEDRTRLQIDTKGIEDSAEYSRSLKAHEYAISAREKLRNEYCWDLG